MSRQLEQVREDRQRKFDHEVLIALEYGLVDAVQDTKRTFVGFAAKFGGSDWLLTVKGDLGDERQVAFVGGATLGDALVKAMREARTDKLRWRADNYVGQS